MRAESLLNVFLTENMYRFRYIIMPILLLSILIAPFVPHHHHHDEVCMIMEQCEKDHVCNDCHTSHHDGSSEDTDHPLCIKNTLSILSNSNITHLRIDDYPILISIISDQTSLESPDREETHIDPYRIFYKPCRGVRVISLRAPPIAL